MIRYASEQSADSRSAAHLDAVRKSYKSLEDDRVVRERLGGGYSLATQAGNQADRRMNDAYQWFTTFP